MMPQKRRKVVLHSQARIFAVRLRKYFCLEKNNNGPLLPVDRVCERVAAALHLTTESVIRITENKQKKSVTKQQKKNSLEKEVKTFSFEPHLDLNSDSNISNLSINEETDLKVKYSYSMSQETAKCDTKTEVELQDIAKSTIKVEYESKNESIDSKNATENDLEVFDISQEKKHKSKVNKKNKEFETKYDKTGNFIITDNSMATCKICFKTVVFRTRNTHFKKCHPSADNRVLIKCDLCDQSFTEKKLKWHIILMHGKLGLKCAYCRTDFSSKATLKDHVINCTKKKRKRVIRPKEIETVQCELCGKQMQQSSLTMHKNRIHFGLAPVCEHCGKTFASRLRLMDHCRAKHGYEKLKCDRCDFQSSNQVSLENHIRKHDGIKPFVCDKCGVSFHGAYLLRQHRRVHTTEKTFKCELCSAVFKSSNNLACHKGTCHNLKQYSCSCGKIFSCQNYAKRHVKKQPIAKEFIDKYHVITAVPFDETKF